jgi:hypothetical protein
MASRRHHPAASEGDEVMDLDKLQSEVNARWGSQDANLCHTSDTNHALVHLMKALGKIASSVNDAEHERRAPTDTEVAKALADIVICAARFANGVVDLDAACAARLAEKFPATATPPQAPREEKRK